MTKSKWIKILAFIGIIFLIVFIVIPPITRKWYRSHSIKYPPEIPANYWKRFSSEAGNFSVFFPGTPETTNQIEKTQSGEITLHLFYVNADIQNTYAVGYSDNPQFAEIANGQDTQEFLGKSQAIIAAKAQGEIVFQQEMKFGNYPAREFEYVAGGKANYSARIKLILVGHRIYQIIYCFSHSKSTSAEPCDLLQLLSP